MMEAGGNSQPGLAPSLSRRRINLKAPLVIGAVAAGVLLIADLLVGRHEKELVREERARKEKLEKTAWYHLRADLDSVSYTADKKYRVSVWIENAFPEDSYYVMIPTLRVFIQVGPQWKEVPGSEVLTARWREGSVVHLTQPISAERIFDIQEKDYFELLPGYMHVRIDNVMYIAEEAEPTRDVAERTDSYYVHLRPVGADDRRLRQLNEFPGDVPIFIPMPPH